MEQPAKRRSASKEDAPREEHQFDFDFGETSLPDLGGSAGGGGGGAGGADLSGMSMEELERMIESAGATKQLIEADKEEEVPPTSKMEEHVEEEKVEMAPSKAPNLSPIDTAVKTESTDSKRKLSAEAAAAFVPATIPPFKGASPSSPVNSPSSKKKELHPAPK